MGRFDVIFLNDAKSFLESLDVKAARKVLLSIEFGLKAIRIRARYCHNL